MEEIEHEHVVEGPADVAVFRQISWEDLDCHPVLHEHVDEHSLRDKRVCAIEGAAVTRHHVFAEADELRGILPHCEAAQEVRARSLRLDRP
eukprot:3593031-Prymnesium_polylepis.1